MNIQLLEEYKNKFIYTLKSVEDFSKNIKLSFISCFKSSVIDTVEQQDDDDIIVTDDSIYLLQIIEIDGEKFTIFFDNGCSHMVCRYEAILRLGNRATQLIEGSKSLEGVGGVTTSTDHGEFLIRLPLHNGKNAVMTGICLEKVTCEFPMYRLNGDVEKDIHDGYKAAGGNVSDLPSLRSSVGGGADIMIGAKYLRHFPKIMFALESGLSIYESPFVSSDGSRGVVCGPHKTFNCIPKPVGWCSASFYSDEYTAYRARTQFCPVQEPKVLEIVDDVTMNPTPEERQSYSSNKLKQFELCENAGSEITFRCVDCRGCLRCRNDSKIEYVSLREEVEDDIVKKSVKVDPETGKCTALLPLTCDPKVKLAPNRNNALKVYNRVVRSLAGSDENRKAVIASEEKLQKRGKVEWVANLPAEIQEALRTNPIQNYIPWRVVHNENSVTTPCRLVFDTSAPTPSRFSLNDILALGHKSLNKLVEVFIRWLCYPVAFHTDVEMMYNTVQLDPEHWCLQRYLFQKDLDPTKPPEPKCVTSIIYGVKPSGNQAEHALRETARLSKDDYPRANEVFQEEFYMDDCLSGASDTAEAHELADQLEAVVSKSDFKFKGFHFSGEPLIEALSKNK